MAKDCLLHCPVIEHALERANQTAHELPYVQNEAWDNANHMAGKLPRGCTGPEAIESTVEIPLPFARFRRWAGKQSVRETTAIEYACPKIKLGILG